jgi:N-methylhydantoinase A
MDSLIIGVDTGGTFTDVIVMDEDGSTVSAKAPTTPDDLAAGVLASIERAAEKMERATEDVLAATRVLRFSGTTATNVLVTRSGALTGMITTRGFEDTLLIGRAVSAWAGNTEDEIRHTYRQRKRDPLVPRRLIRTVAERVDHEGRVLVSLDLDELNRAVDELVAEGIESLAICFLWSIRHPEHEAQAKRRIQERHPSLSVHCSYDVAPTVGEYERFQTTAVDAFTAPVLVAFLDGLRDRMRARGFTGQLLVAQADGGCLYADETRPVYTVQSGPAAGIIASREEGRDIGHRNLICTDVGGTTFDVGLVSDGNWVHAREPVVGRFNLGIPMIEIESIGAGGGSIASMDEFGLLHVGPRSAGARPGPACYGLGGTEPTVTDADLVLGYLNPEFFLGGSMSLSREAAEQALATLATRLDRVVAATAAAVFEIANAHMAALLHRRVVARGHDPRDFTVLAYGGAGAVHSAFYGADAGVGEVVVPALAGTFSARGVTTAPLLHTAQAYGFAAMPMDPEVFNKTFQELEAKVVARLDADDVPAARRGVAYYVEMRYGVQVHTVRLEIPANMYDLDGLHALGESFDQTYERLYGRGSGFVEAGRFVTSFTVEGTGTLPAPERRRHAVQGEDAAQALIGNRDAYFDGGFTATQIYRYERLQAGNVLATPAIVEGDETTVVIPPRCEARVDEFLNIRIGGLSRNGN